MNNKFGIKIDKLTRSIENSASGISVKTDIFEVSEKDIKRLNKKDRLFNWKKEAKDLMKIVCKLVILSDSEIIQGLISLRFV